MPNKFIQPTAKSVAIFAKTQKVAPLLPAADDGVKFTRHQYMEITIWGVLTGAALPLFGYLAFHWLATEREKQSRYAQACNEYRMKIIEAVSVIPESNVRWDNAALESIPGMLKSIEVAVEVFKYFLSKNESKRLAESHKVFKELVNSQIPEALSTANVMYGGGQLTPGQAKKEFWVKVEELKKYANKT